MATLNENIAKTKDNFRNIRDAINVVGDAVAYEPLINEPVEEYPARINDVAEMYGQSKYDEGYEHGDEDGKAEILAESKYIPKTATGKVISLTDVSEVAHKVKVYGDNQEVEVFGKNLLPYPYLKTSAVSVNGVTITPNEDGSISIYGTATNAVSLRMHDRLQLKDGVTYTIGDNSDNWAFYIAYKDESGATRYWGATTIQNETVFVWRSSYTYVGIYIQATKVGVLYDETIYPIIVAGVGGTSPWEGYREPQTITATPNGTEVPSMCPNMTFLADTDITVDYYGSFGMAENELAMWNALTNFGKRTAFSSALSYSNYAGHIIPEGLYRPRQVIGQMCYVYQGVELPRGIDCSEFDASTTVLSYHMDRTFAYAPNLKYVYDMKVPAGTVYTGTFRNCANLETIEIIRCNEQTIFDANCFNGCSKLTHCIFSGVIANDINMQWSPLLDAESLMSLVDCLMFMEDVFDDDGELVENNAYTKTVTLSPESWAILDGIMHPNWEGDPDEPYTYKTHVGALQWNIG